jgi:DNA-binding NtrC family response regulator
VIARTILFGAEDGFRASPFGEALQRCGSEMLVVDTEEHLLHLLNQFSLDCAVVLCTEQVDTEILRIAEEVRRIARHCPLLVLRSAVSPENPITAVIGSSSDLPGQDSPSQKIVARMKSMSVSGEQVRIRQTVCPQLIGGDRLVGCGAAMTRVRCQIARIAATNANVLITGESGTGKELAAELIHNNSNRSSCLFVAVNCAAMPETLLESELFGYARGAFTGANTSRAGKLEHAAGGTLFLDEIGDMSLNAQAKILRAVESRVIQRLGSNVDTRIEVRLVAATNQDLESMMREKKFRQDLYFRLNVVRLNLPPLRDRREDIPELVESILHELSDRRATTVRHIENEVIHRLQRHDWPGNIRELRNVLESVLVFSSSRSIGMADVPVEISRTLRSCGKSVPDERAKIITALVSAGWNRNRAAEILQCSRMTLYRKMVRHEIASERH